MNFDEIAKRAHDGVYDSDLPAGEPRAAAWEAYKRDAAQKGADFREHLRSALAEIGVPVDAIGLVAALAWEDGHAHGYSEVVIHAERLGLLAERVAVAARRDAREGLLARLEGVKHIARENFLPLIDEVLPEEGGRP